VRHCVRELRRRLATERTERARHVATLEAALEESLQGIRGKR
jgi:hypothetical protein